MAHKVEVMDTKPKRKTVFATFVNSQSTALRHRGAAVTTVAKVDCLAVGKLAAMAAKPITKNMYTVDHSVVLTTQGKLSDPATRHAVTEHIEAVANERQKALEYLQAIGVASPAGHLSERYGG
jgi:hypothetical protein